MWMIHFFEATLNNVLVIKSMMRCFELMFDLKVIFLRVALGLYGWRDLQNF